MINRKPTSSIPRQGPGCQGPGYQGGFRFLYPTSSPLLGSDLPPKERANARMTSSNPNSWTTSPGCDLSRVAHRLDIRTARREERTLKNPERFPSALVDRPMTFLGLDSHLTRPVPESPSLLPSAPRLPVKESPPKGLPESQLPFPRLAHVDEQLRIFLVGGRQHVNPRFHETSSYKRSGRPSSAKSRPSYPFSLCPKRSVHEPTGRQRQRQQPMMVSFQAQRRVTCRIPLPSPKARSAWDS